MKNIVKEILESEKTYINDLTKWSVEFRKNILCSPNVVSVNKSAFITKIFVNIADILNLHKKIYAEFSESTIGDNHILTDVLLEFIDRFSCYKEYIRNMPIADYYIKVEASKSLDFKNLLMNFLNTHSSLGLSYTHFLYRPPQKLIRYELLFSKVKKKENSEDRILKTETLINKLSLLNTEIDQIYSESKNYARIFEIFNCLKSSAQNNICLELITDKRVLIKEAVVSIYFEKTKLIQNYKLFIFDHLILICDFTLKEFFEIYHLVKVISYLQLEIKENANEQLIELIYDEKILLYFSDNKNSSMWYKIIKSASDAYKETINKQIKLSKFRIDTKISNLATVITFKPSINSDINDRFKSPIVEPLVYDYKRETSVIEKIFFRSKFFGSKFILDFVHPQECDKEILIFSTINGIFKKINNEINMIYNKPASKIYYDHTHSLLLFLQEQMLFISPFTGKATFLDPILIEKQTIAFFYYNIRDAKYLAITNSSTEYESKYSIYTISLYNQKIIINFVRKAFIGAKINHMLALDDMIIIASDSAKIINPYTLQTTDFVNPFDQIIPYYFHCVEEKYPKYICQISQTKVLVCYLSCGFFVNRNGNLLTDQPIFSWQFNADEVMYSKGYLIVLNKKQCAIMNEGKMVFYEENKGYKICELNHKLHLYDNSFLYCIENE